MQECANSTTEELLEEVCDDEDDDNTDITTYQEATSDCAVRYILLRSCWRRCVMMRMTTIRTSQHTRRILLTALSGIFY